MFKNIIFANLTTGKRLNVFHSDKFIFSLTTPLFQMYTLSIIDVNFTGKTYKWFYRFRFWKLTFNRVHKTTVFFKNRILSKKYGKTKFRLFLYSKQLKKNLVTIFDTTRRYNIFTQRGLKVRGRLFYKKRGKISTYR